MNISVGPQCLRKVVDTPVVYNDRGHGPEFPDQVIDVPVAMQRHVPWCSRWS